MSSTSTFQELAGILFPSQTAKDLAEKRVLQQRAEQAAKDEEERQKQLAEEEAKRAKQQRIEEKRLKAEKKLQEMAKQRALEAEQEAEQLRQAALAKEKAAQEEAHRKKQEAEAQKRRDAETKKQMEMRKREEEMEKQRKLEEEREKKRQEMAKKRRDSEQQAEKRWLKQQVQSGNIKLTKKAGGLVVASPRGGKAPKVDDSLSWVKTAEDLGEDIEIEEDPEEKRREEERKRQEEEARMKARRLKVVRQEQEKPKRHADDIEESDDATKWVVKEQNLILKALKNHKGIDSAPTGQDLMTLPDRLDSRDNKFTALLQTYSIMVKVVTESGFSGLRNEVQNGNLSVLTRCIEPLAGIIKESPGNIVAMLCLGYLSFCGDKSLHQQIVALKSIPNSVEGWIGWIVGSRLFFEYLSWWQTGSNGNSPDSEWVLSCEDPAFQTGSASSGRKDRRIQRESARAKIEQLVDCMVVKGINSKSVRAILMKFDTLMDQYESKRNQIQEVTTDKQQSQAEKIRSLQGSNVEQLQLQVDRAQQSLQEAQREEDKKKRELRNMRSEIQRSEARASEARQRLQELAKMQAQLEKEREELEGNNADLLTALEDDEHDF